MRAVRVHAFGPIEAARVETVDDPRPGPGEVAIRAAAIGVNFPDLLVIRGQYQVKPPLPFSPGKELAGEIVAIGAGVAGLEPGDRVMAQVEYGAYAEIVIAPAAMTFRMPDEMSFEAGAALGLTYQTAWFALRAHADVQPGEIVLVPGAAGGVGLAAVELAKAMGAVVVAGVRHPEQSDLLRAHGADHVVDLSVADLRSALRDQLRTATGGRLADVVIEPVGGEVFDASLRALAWRGRLVVVGFASGRIPSAAANYLLVKNIFVSGMQWTDYRDRQPAAVRDAQQAMYGMWREGRLRPPIMAPHPLDGFADALARIERGRLLGKVLLLPGGA
ncbi:MAG: NADPH:quinone oxidoreductase family protein [Alphaproteobacteria bacterium]